MKPSQPIYRPPSARIGYNRTESPESHTSSTTSTSHSNNESNKITNTSNYTNITNGKSFSVDLILKNLIIDQKQKL